MNTQEISHDEFVSMYEEGQLEERFSTTSETFYQVSCKDGAKKCLVVNSIGRCVLIEM